MSSLDAQSAGTHKSGELTFRHIYTEVSRGVVGVAVSVLVFLVVVNGAHFDPYWGLIVAYVVACGISFVWFRNWRSASLWPLVPLAVMAPFSIPAYQISPIMLLAIVALGTNILTGYAGQISVAQGSLVGVGAYTTGLLMVNEGWSFWLTIPIAAITAGLVGLVVAIPSARLSGVYQVMTSLALAVSFPALVVYFNSLTNGNIGVTVSVTPTEPGWMTHIVTMSQDQYLYLIGLLLLAIMLFIAWNIVRRYPGRAMRAIRDHDIVANVVGVNVARYKILSFVVASMFAGVAGSLYAVTVGIVSPDGFGLFYSIQFLVMIVVGGLGTLSGSILGAVFLWELSSRVQQVSIPGSSVTLSDQVIFGLVLILALIFVRSGLISVLKSLSEVLEKALNRVWPRSAKIDERSNAEMMESTDLALAQLTDGPIEDTTPSTLEERPRTGS